MKSVGVYTFFTLEILSLHSQVNYWIFRGSLIHHKKHCEVKLFCTCNRTCNRYTCYFKYRTVSRKIDCYRKWLSDWALLQRGPDNLIHWFWFFSGTFFYFNKKTRLIWNKFKYKWFISKSGFIDQFKKPFIFGYLNAFCININWLYFGSTQRLNLQALSFWSIYLQ